MENDKKLNALQHEMSPYLLQHKANPVNWLPWGEEAFQRAQAEDKPVFLSIGYSTCHWCHVMAHESFEDNEAARILNKHFISIKVDREERPDIDAVYMSACIAMNGSGGWPLTILMTPEQKPFWAGTYLPKSLLISLLKEAARLWKASREALLTAGDELTAYLQEEKSISPDAPKRELPIRAAAQFAASFDPRWGGFGGAPKFPTPHNLVFLIRYAHLTGDNNAMKMAEKTLEAMYRGGLFDHIGGGFSRYSTDEKWLIPHFEKMLYDNALLLFAYCEAYAHTRRTLYAKIARRTADYVLRELCSPEGGLYCGQDADSEGVEGKYYVFTPEELGACLGEEDAKLFCSRYDVTAGGNFEGRSIPNLIGQQNIDIEPQGIHEILHKLRSYRSERTKLHKDDKVLTAWNGLMIAALARASLVLSEPDYLAAAKRAVQFIGKNLTDQNGRLLARWRDEQGAFAGKLDDYAFLAWGLLELYSVTFEHQYLSEAERLAQILLEQFFDRGNGGLYPYPSDGEQLISRAKDVYDGAIPSGNSVAALVFSRLSRLTAQQKWRDVEQRQLSYLAGAVVEYPAGHSFAMLALLEALWPSAELVCTAKEAPPELTEFLREKPRNGLCSLLKTPENEKQLAQLAPFTAEYPIPNEGALYYLCQNGACSKPVGSIAELEKLLQA